jgi:hypothetical protein
MTKKSSEMFFGRKKNTKVSNRNVFANCYFSKKVFVLLSYDVKNDFKVCRRELHSVHVFGKENDSFFTQRQRKRKHRCYQQMQSPQLHHFL